MPVLLIGPSDFNIATEFTQLIGVSSTNASFKNILEDTDPQIGGLSNFSMNYYNGVNTYLFNLAIQSSNGTRGYVEVIYPWYEASTGTTIIGNNKQAFEAYSGSIDIRATGIYPYSFSYWYESSSATFYYTSTLAFAYSDPVVQDPFALFTAYFA